MGGSPKFLVAAVTLTGEESNWNRIEDLAEGIAPRGQQLWRIMLSEEILQRVHQSYFNLLQSARLILRLHALVLK
jgi:hypothetical protein